MSACNYVYGGIRCGRVAKKKCGVYVDGHEPGEWRKLCDQHAVDYGRSAFDRFEHERMVRVLTLDLEDA